MRTYVSTLGFHETRVTRPVIKHGIGEGDRVVLIRPASEGSEGRADAAVGYVEDMVEEIEPGASVAVETVETGRFETTVLQCSEVLTAVDEDRELVINFGGGAREVLLPLMVAAVLHAPLVDKSFQYTDVDQEVETLSIPDLTARIPEKTHPTFRLVADAGGEQNLSELTTQSSRTKSTVVRHLEALEDAGVVTTRTVENSKHVSLSPTGRFRNRAMCSRDGVDAEE